MFTAVLTATRSKTLEVQDTATKKLTMFTDGNKGYRVAALCRRNVAKSLIEFLVKHRAHSLDICINIRMYEHARTTTIVC